VTPDAKAALRAELRKKLRVMSAEERSRASERLDAAALEAIARLALPAGHLVGVFAPTPTEAGPRSLLAALAALGLRLAFPRVSGPGALSFHVLPDPSALAPGFRGILEPPPDAPEVSPAALALLLVPGLGFDRDGGRLGRGGGFYDRLLEALPLATLRLGMAFACQLLPTPLPREPHDAPVDAVVTEGGLSATARWPR
jgi:5-formyltetrahydrofolate cyclo-ligase